MSINDSTKHHQNLKVGDYDRLSDLKRGQIAQVWISIMTMLN